MSGFRINTFTTSQTMLRQRGEIQQQQLEASNRLASGKRINKAADDASGLSLADDLETRTQSIGSAIDNLQDGVSLLQVMDSGLETITNKVQRLRELAVRGANDTIRGLSDEDGQTNDERLALQREYETILNEIDRFASNVSFNERPLLAHGFNPDLLGEPLLSERPDLSQGQAQSDRSLSRNADFSAWPDDEPMPEFWNYDGSGDPEEEVERVSDDALFGDHSMRLKDITGSFSTRNFISQEFDIEPLEAGESREYRIGFWAKVDADTDVEEMPEFEIATEWGGQAGGAFGDGDGPMQGEFTAEGEWQYFERTFESRSGDSSAWAEPNKAKVDIRFKDEESEFFFGDPVFTRDIIVDGTFIVPQNSKLNFQVGPDNGDQFELSSDDVPHVSTSSLGIRNTSLNSTDRAEQALAQLDRALRSLGDRRSRVGAYQNRFERMTSVQKTQRLNELQAESRIRDTNFAQMTAKRLNKNIKLRLNSAMLAQVGTTSNQALSLIQTGDPVIGENGEQSMGPGGDGTNSN